MFQRYMPATPTPEILRAPLENIVLKAKELDMHDTPSQILALAMNPPNLRNIENTIWNLKEVGGLLQTCRGIRTNADGDLTFMGSVMAGLPLDVHLSKLILLGHMFSCLEEAIIIGMHFFVVTDVFTGCLFQLPASPSPTSSSFRSRTVSCFTRNYWCGPTAVTAIRSPCWICTM